MEQFTASEVRDYLFSIEERSSRQWLIAHDAELGMLRQFADLLEAQERAVPIYQLMATDDSWWDVSRELYEAEGSHAGRTRILYTHPTLSDAERLADALQPFANLLQPLHASTPDDRPIYGINKAEITAGDLRHANEALAAHSARAQPNIPDLTDEEWEILFHLYPELKARLQKVFDAHDAQAQPPAQSKYAPPYPDQAQDPFWKVPGMVDTRPKAQPPAASVTDAMVRRAQDCLHDKGKDIGYYHMRAALEAALAAQENPNG